MPLHRLLHIAPCFLLLLAVFCACTEEEVVPVAPTRTLTVDLGITLTRAAQGTSIGDGSQPNDLQLWIFDQDNRLLDYAAITDANDLFFSGSDALGELVNTIQRIVEVESTVTALHVHVVLNGVSSGLKLDETSTPDNIAQATFSLPTGDQTWTGDNTVPIYGDAERTIDGYQKEYSLTVKANRAVGKLELLFTKDSESGYLQINKVELTHLPEEGYLAKSPESVTISSSESIVLFEGTTEITDYLPQNAASLGDFSRYESSFHSLTADYLLENPQGKNWSGDGNQDWTYPSTPEAEENGYLLTVHYQTSAGGTEKTQAIYLPKIVRNEWNKIFARVKSDGYELQLHVVDWEVEDIEVNFEDNLSYTSGGWDEETIIGYLDAEKTRVHVNPDETAVLRFTIQTPNTATWRAQLVGADINAFEFVGEHSGNAYGADGQPVEQQIQVRVTNPESDSSFEVQLQVFATIGGIDYELDLTNRDDGTVSPDEGIVQRFTLIQSR
ncbi:MAG TPA: DUF4906 domain-containing protein [Candidatus Bacteroides merdipullorum]|uniref:DUF4906 domain-containing protein n=1 Tax=Candidatus Bacteroides merdipullorum TaxID=2838474 RepID=A0A9D2CWP8_9BACE|nr:DUF4906 domain-containing protein [Candidatus Bacteroides merdipullorum]